MAAERDYGKEIDALRAQLEQLQTMCAQQWGVFQPEAEEGAPTTHGEARRVSIMRNMHPDARLSGQMEELCEQTERRGVSGLVTYLGVYRSSEQQSNWIRKAVSTDGLLSLLERGIASKVLACIGNRNRLAILLELLRGPETVATLTEKCGFGSTGQAYHHLKPLLAADIVAEETKGVYQVPTRKIQGIIMLLAGISDMVDERFTQCAWEPAAQEAESDETDESAELEH